MDISVIICTHNRARNLSVLFDSLFGLEIPGNLTWEILLVDNASTDETPEMIEHEMSSRRLPLVVLEEQDIGKSRALNSALCRARGELMIFADDDVIPSPGWIRSYYEAAWKNPHVLGFCGRVLPQWEGELPRWLCKEVMTALPEGLINRCDYGDKECFLPEHRVPGGLNAALKKKAVVKMGFFREDIGPGTSIPYAEDTDYMRRLLDYGHEFLYVPGALVYHRNPVERMTKDYATTWVFEVARSRILAFSVNPATRRLFGVPRYLWKQLFQRSAAWLFEPRTHCRFKRKLRWKHTLGEIYGYKALQQNKSR
jgi:glycosyltransferase involved in cell wall biosynthesis